MASGRKSLLSTVSLTGRLTATALPGRWRFRRMASFSMLWTLRTSSWWVLKPRGGSIRWRVGVGRLPFAVAVSPKGDRVYVSNVGTFQYSVVPGFDLKRAGETGLDFPPFATGTPEAEQGTVIAGKRIPGLGDPNVPESNSVFVLDASGSPPTVLARIRTGLAIGNQVRGRVESRRRRRGT